MSRSIGQRIATLGVSTLLVSIAAGAAAADLQVGDQAPAFSMVGSDGKTYTLDQFRGKSAVVLAWFPKAFTGGCTKECKSMRENSKQLHALKVAYFTASVDTPELNKKFAESLDLDYPILSDPDKTAANAYGVMSGAVSQVAGPFTLIKRESFEPSTNRSTHLRRGPMSRPRSRS